jgi:hypothetical protein
VARQSKASHGLRIRREIGREQARTWWHSWHLHGIGRAGRRSSWPLCVSRRVGGASASCRVGEGRVVPWGEKEHVGGKSLGSGSFRFQKVVERAWLASVPDWSGWLGTWEGLKPPKVTSA